VKIKCEICNKSFKFINYLHLRTHGISVEEYKNRFPDAVLGDPWNKGLSINPDSPNYDPRIVKNIESRKATMLEKYGSLSVSQFIEYDVASDETRQKMSIAAKKRWGRERDKIIEAQNKGKHSSDLFRKVHLEIGRKTLTKMWADPKWRKRFEEEIHPKMIKGWKNSLKWRTVMTSKEYAKKQGKKTAENWQDSKFREKTIKAAVASRHQFPNKFELEIESIIQDNDLPFEYTGSGEMIIAGLNPDFVCVEKGLILACYGCYWHGCPEHHPEKKKQYEHALKRVERFEFHGYKVLVVWEHELKHKTKLVKKLRVFAGDTH